MKKVVCLHNVYHEGRYLSAGVDVALPDEVACNWVKRGIAKFVGGETPVAVDDTPKRGRPPKKKHGGKRK